jgi:prephenate dehydrogenase
MSAATGLDILDTLEVRTDDDLGSIRIVGTGLLGTSIGLGLARAGVRARLHDASPHALLLAHDLGAGDLGSGDRQDDPDLIVVATPPDVTAAVVVAELARYPNATVTDVASVKHSVLRELGEQRADLRRYVGGHPMAGRERSGPLGGRPDLFEGRAWVLCPAGPTDPARVEHVARLARRLGATPRTMTASQHDSAVAVVSHLPQVMASLVAARLNDAGPSVALAGQAVRDVTRVAASDPGLWVQILAANADPVADVLLALRADLDAVVAAIGALRGAGPISSADRAAARIALAGALTAGNAGRARLPGKHGDRPGAYEVVTVLVPDSPGALGVLFTAVARAGVNVEELSLESLPGNARGVLALSVLAPARAALEAVFDTCGWRTLS